MPTASRLRIQVFGAFDATIDGVTPPGIWHRSAAQLLALLACRHGKTCHDAWVADMLWPDTGSLDSLRATIAALRRALGPEAHRVETVNGTVRLRTEGADIDVVTYDLAAAAGDEASLRLAVRLYGAGLLEMWSDGWVEAEREPRREAYIDALRTLAAGAVARSDFGLATRCYRRLVRARPVEESAWLGLFTSLVEMGERLEAVRVYEIYRDRLAAHHLAPPAAISVQYHALIAAPLGPAPELNRDFTGFEPAGGAVPLASPYYIERAADSVCHAAVERMDSFVLVRGPRQIGKTSLVARALDRARKAGARIALTDFQ